jgi:hypothetical protein
MIALSFYLGGVVTLFWSDVISPSGRARFRQWQPWFLYVGWPLMLVITVVAFLWWWLCTGSARGFAAGTWELLVTSQLKRVERKIRERRA